MESIRWAEEIAERLVPGQLVGVAVGGGALGLALGHDASMSSVASTTSDRPAEPYPLTSFGFTSFGLTSFGDLDDEAIVGLIATIDRRAAPRWVWWDRSIANRLARHDVTILRSWDIPTVHRLLHGGWRTSTPQIWAWLHNLDATRLPQLGQLDLLAATTADTGSDDTRTDAIDDVRADDPNDPVQPDGYLRPDWVSGGYAATPQRLARWAALALDVQRLQARRLDERGPRTPTTARSESAAEYLCAQLEVSGLPIDLDAVKQIIGAAAGPRPAAASDEDRARAERDRPVLDLVPPGVRVDLRSPNDVRAMLRHVAIDVPNTRAGRLERHRGEHPIVDALLAWRKAERIATTYGWRWLDEHVDSTASPTGWGRLRGEWSSCDGAAGRMTATAGLHNLPAEMRPAVAAEPGYLFVRADLGQIEPRVLAAVSLDPAFIAASAQADLYSPVAERLKVDRATAKVAVLGAMYGGTSGAQAGALRGLQRSYPVAMGLLADAAATGEAGDDVYTIGGRRIRMGNTTDETGLDDGAADADGQFDSRLDRARSRAAARGRYARNAIIQGAAAEFFKVWAILVRSRVQPLGGEIVLCLHDELLVHVPADQAEAAVSAVDDALVEAAYRWLPEPARGPNGVQFVTDTSIVARWSDAKP